MDVRQNLSIEPDGIYEALAHFMKENLDWQLTCWGMKERLVEQPSMVVKTWAPGSRGKGT